MSHADRSRTLQAPGADYEQGALGYAAHRQIHPSVLQGLCLRGHLGSGSRCLEVGCGTGNYASALLRHVRCVAFGLDPASAMLAHARAQPECVVWLLGRAEQLSFADDALDLVFSVDVIHHISDKVAFFREVRRTLRPGGRVCTVTDSEEIIRRREILSGYFPETVEYELARYPRITQLEAWLAATGIENQGVITVKAQYQVTNAQPFRDKAYSALHLISEAAWQDGLERLEGDLARGPIRGSSRYACVWGRKPDNQLRPEPCGVRPARTGFPGNSGEYRAQTE
jgi:ubiquinone/menaquinone biosynthesis C-methylase UbiE